MGITGSFLIISVIILVILDVGLDNSLETDKKIARANMDRRVSPIEKTLEECVWIWKISFSLDNCLETPDPPHRGR